MHKYKLKQVCTCALDCKLIPPKKKGGDLRKKGRIFLRKCFQGRPILFGLKNWLKNLAARRKEAKIFS
jgi:hypothetical protein